MARADTKDEPPICVGSDRRITPACIERPCTRCAQPVFTQDVRSRAFAPICPACFIALAEADDQLVIVLPPGVTRAAFLALLRRRVH